MGSTEVDLERLSSADANFRANTPERVAVTASIVAVAYYVCALAGAVQPASAHGAPNLWLSNAMLLAVLLMTPWREWWAYTLAALVAHLLTYAFAGVSAAVTSVEVVANFGQVVSSAWLVRYLIAPGGWFEQLRHTTWFIVLAGLVIPAAIAMAASAALLWIGAIDDFWSAWRVRFRSNSIAVLTMTPMIVTIWARFRADSARLERGRGLESLLLTLSLAVVGALLLTPSPVLAQYELVLLYLPIPFFLWTATRYGLACMSSAVLAVGSLLIWAASNDIGVFSIGTFPVDGMDIDLFLIVSTIPLMMLAVAFEEKQQLLRQARVGKDNFKRLAESTAAIPWEADADRWEFSYVGPQAEGMLGIPLHRWLEDGFFGLRFHPDDRESVLGAFAEAVETGEGVVLEYRMTNAADEVVWVSDIVHCERLPTGRTRLRGFMINNTERRRAARELEFLRERMTQASRLATAAELTASISHDLYQPLTAILHNAEVAEQLLSETHPDAAELRRVVADILDDDHRAREILQRMRGLMQSGKIVNELLDFRRLVRATLDLVASEAAIRSVRVDLVSERDEVMVSGDAIHLQQLVMNLVVNAFDAVTERPGTDRCVTVRLENEDGLHLLLTVADTGRGISETVMATLFEPFQTTKADGLGIGLSITRRIAEAHGGEIWAENGQAGGARFRVRLPLASQGLARP